MTDVIHHVPDVDKLFASLQRILTKNGKLCIATESHDQIENRFIVDYFSATYFLQLAVEYNELAVAIENRCA